HTCENQAKNPLGNLVEVGTSGISGPCNPRPSGRGGCQTPLLLNTPLPLAGAQVQAMYRDCWPVEGLPLWAKHILGAARQFVFAPERRQRLPEVALLAGSILAYTAATHPALPTGFWDRAPRPTSG